MTISYVSAPNKRTAISQTFNPVNYEGVASYADPYANHTTLLLKGNGTNGVINNNFQDSSSNSFAITRYGNTTQGSFSPYGTNWSNYFDGSSSLNQSSTTAWNFLHNGSSWTIEFDIFPTNTDLTVLASNVKITANTGFTLQINSAVAKDVGFYIFNGSTYTGFSSSANLSINQWNHVGITFETSTKTCTFYINGILSGSSSNTGFSYPSGNSTYGMSIGCEASSLLYDFTGYLSNFRISNVVRSGMTTVPTTPFANDANTSLLTCQSNRFIDNSSNSYALTTSGSLSVQRLGPFAPSAPYITSVSGGSAYFDGSGDYLTAPNSDAIAFGSGDLTIECWCYSLVTTGGADQIILGKYTGSFGSSSFGISHNNTTLSATFYTGGTSYFTMTSSVALQGNVWNHIAISRSGNSWYMFLNGVQVASTTQNVTIISNTTALYVGGEPFYNQMFTGYISNLRIVKGTAVYTTAFTPPSAPLTAITNTSVLLSFTNAGIYDDTSTTMLETAGNTSVSTSTKKYGSGSIYFDGTGDYLISPALQSNAFGTGDLTFECWIYATTASDSPIYESRSTNSNTNGFTVTAYSSTVIRVYTTAVLVTATVSDYVNKWTHVAYTRQSGPNRLFVNGLLVATATATDNFTNTTSIIGGGRYSTNNVSAYFTGYIDDLRITKGIARYTTDFIPPQAELPFYGGAKTYTTDTVDLGGVDFPVYKYNTLLLRGDGTNGTQNNTFLDSSANNYSMTRNGNSTQGTFTPYGSNWSNYFDGSGDYLSFSGGAPNTIGTSSATIEFWMYATANDGYRRIITSNNGGFTTGDFIIRFNNGTFLAGDTSNSISAPLPATNQWYHVAWVGVGGSTQTLYINGTAVATGTTYNLTRPLLYIGGYYTVTGEYFAGYLSNVRVVKGTAVYTSNFTPPTEPLAAIANTSLLTCADNRLIDESTNGLTITKNGDVSVHRFSPFAPTSAYSSGTNGGSGYFDGTGDYLTTSATSNFNVTGDFTLECWFYLTAAANNTFFTVGTPRVNFNWGMAINSDGTITFMSNPSNNWDISGIYTSTATVPIRAWTHVAAVKNGSNFSMYINGVSVYSTNSFSQPTAASGTIYVATYYANTNNDGSFVNGFMTDLRLVKGTAVYTTAFTPPTAPLTAIANTSLLLSFQNSGILDNTMINDFETIGNAQISTSVKKYGTGSMYFDGSGDYLVPSSASSNLNLVLGAGDFTIEFWVYFISGLGSDIVLYDSRPLSTNGAYPTLYVNSSSQLSYVVSGSDRITSGTAFTTSTWYHVAVCRNASVTRMFINGFQVGTPYSDTTSYLNPVRRPVIAINGYNESAAQLNGYIDDLRVTKGFARYTRNFIPPTATLPTA